MRKVWWIICASLLLTACGGGTGNDAGGKGAAAGPQLELKVDGKDSVLPLKSGVMQAFQQDSSDPKWKAATYGFTLANYELATGGDLAKTLTKPEETRVFFKLYGEPGTDKTAPIKPGVHKADAKEFPSYDATSLTIITFADGKQKVVMSQDSPAIDTKGEVKITSVEGDTVKGEINIATANKLGAKGTFTAKIKPIGF